MFKIDLPNAADRIADFIETAEENITGDGKGPERKAWVVEQALEADELPGWIPKATRKIVMEWVVEQIFQFVDAQIDNIVEKLRAKKEVRQAAKTARVKTPTPEEVDAALTGTGRRRRTVKKKD